MVGLPHRAGEGSLAQVKKASAPPRLNYLGTISSLR